MPSKRSKKNKNKQKQNLQNSSTETTTISTWNPHTASPQARWDRVLIESPTYLDAFLATSLCKICDEKCDSHPQRSFGGLQEPVKLECGHSFGKFCLRVWIILCPIGPFCPDCYEEISEEFMDQQDLRRYYYHEDFLSSPYKTHVFTKVMTKSKHGKILARSSVKVADTLSQILCSSAGYLAKSIGSHTDHLIATVEPLPAHLQTKVSDKDKRELQDFKVVTGVVSTCSTAAVDLVGAGLMTLGGYMAPFVKKSATDILVKVGECEEQNARNAVENGMETAKGIFYGIGTFFRALEHSARVVGSAATTNAARYVEHKYGSEAGAAAKDAAAIAGNVGNTALNIKTLPLPTSIKNTARITRPNSYRQIQSHTESTYECGYL